MRHRKLAGGEKEWFEIERWHCPKCGKLHRVLPDFLAPYKHYDVDIITGTLDGTVTPDKKAFEDNPCETTMERWKAWLKQNYDFINGYMKSIAMRLLYIGIELLYSMVDIVKELRKKDKRGWLKGILRAVYNTGATLEPYRG